MVGAERKALAPSVHCLWRSRLTRYWAETEEHDENGREVVLTGLPYYVF